MTDPQLWARLQDYPFPADSGGRSFLDQLRADQKISERTARRGIAEYRRFLYLSATGVSRTVPSRAVDAVWHLHLTHTRDYWERFVPDVLRGKPIHHAPGTPEGHQTDYAATLKRYEMEFGEAPPRGIWRKGNRAGDWAATGFTGLFALFWIAMSVSTGAPALFVLLSGLVVILAFVATLGPHLHRAGFEVGFGIDIWSDSEAGDCGDGGGGCGD